MDDDKTLCELLEKMLTAEGYNTFSVHDAASALHFIRKEEYDLLILDNRLPDALGLDLMLDICEIKPDLPVVMLTGMSNLETALRAYERGVASYIEKSTDIAEIIPKIKETIKKKDGARIGQTPTNDLKNTLLSFTYNLREQLQIIRTGVEYLHLNKYVVDTDINVVDLVLSSIEAANSLVQSVDSLLHNDDSRQV